VAQVFISFIHDEQRVAQAVAHVITGVLKKSVFYAANNFQMFAGDVWLERIRAELSEAKVVVLMLSGESVKRPWINFEAGAAWLAGKALIPACFGGLTKGTMPKPYSGIQGVDLPDDIGYLVSSIEHHLEPQDATAAFVTPMLFRGCRAHRDIVAALQGEYVPHRDGEGWDDRCQCAILQPSPPPLAP